MARNPISGETLRSVTETTRKKQKGKSRLAGKSQFCNPADRLQSNAPMSRNPPTLIALDCDDYAAKYVGRTATGEQFFITTPFVPAIGVDAGREFLAVYRFDQRGKLLDARIDDLGSRAELDLDQAGKLLAQRVADLGPVKFGRIEVQPFEIERFGTTFGIVPRSPETDQDGWWAEVQPGNYMAFHEPWDSGEYDT
jgi:hypothetical protein